MKVIGRGKHSRLLAEKLECGRNKNDDIIVRYGRVDLREARIEINRNDALKLARNKLVSLFHFKSAGLPVPRFSKEISGLRFPILGRSFYHHGGKDIKVIKSMIDFIECDYYIEFLPVEKEYRFHVVDGGIISASRKYDGDENVFCRNYSTGWRFKEVKRYSPELPVISKEAVKCLGLDFGAVDIIISEGKPYVLEVNTAPGMIERRAEAYANAIKKYINVLDSTMKGV